MNIKDNRSHSAAELKTQAEKKVRQKMIPPMEDLTALPPEKILQLFYDLEIHQIELEMQNNELRRSQEELQASQKRYFDLFDLAPVGIALSMKKD